VTRTVARCAGSLSRLSFGTNLYPSPAFGKYEAM